MSKVHIQISTGLKEFGGVSENNSYLYAKLIDLRSKRVITDEEYKTLREALRIRSEIKPIKEEINQVVNEEANDDKKWSKGLQYSLKIIDKHINWATKDDAIGKESTND